MRKDIQQFLALQNRELVTKDHLSLIFVKDLDQGIELLKKLLYFFVDKKTALFLSGGSTPKGLYEDLANEKKLETGEAALVDERYGDPKREKSNEKMIRDTKLLSYFEQKKIPFHSVLRLHPKGVATDFARIYSKKIGHLLKFKKKIAIMGIGEDGHTAGIPPEIRNSKFEIRNYVTTVNNFPGEFGKRITLTFNALSKMDLLIVLVFGSAKKNALKLMFEKGSRGEIPARFYTKPGIAEKTILITDQKVYN